MILHLLALLVAAPNVAAQNLGEPQYQLTGKNYSQEAAAIQQMLYNTAGAVKGINSAIATANATISSDAVAIANLNARTSTRNVAVSSKSWTYSSSATSLTAVTGSTATLLNVAATSKVRITWHFDWSMDNGVSNFQAHIMFNNLDTNQGCHNRVPNLNTIGTCSGSLITSVVPASGTNTASVMMKTDANTLSIDTTVNPELNMEELPQ